jgi:hypothetical protein
MGRAVIVVLAGGQAHARSALRVHPRAGEA